MSTKEECEASKHKYAEKTVWQNGGTEEDCVNHKCGHGDSVDKREHKEEEFLWDLLDIYNILGFYTILSSHLVKILLADTPKTNNHLSSLSLGRVYSQIWSY